MLPLFRSVKLEPFGSKKCLGYPRTNQSQHGCDWTVQGTRNHLVKKTPGCPCDVHLVSCRVFQWARMWGWTYLSNIVSSWPLLFRWWIGCTPKRSWDSTLLRGVLQIFISVRWKVLRVTLRTCLTAIGKQKHAFLESTELSILDWSWPDYMLFMKCVATLVKIIDAIGCIIIWLFPLMKKVGWQNSSPCFTLFYLIWPYFVSQYATALFTPNSTPGSAQYTTNTPAMCMKYSCGPDCYLKKQIAKYCFGAMLFFI